MTVPNKGVFKVDLIKLIRAKHENIYRKITLSMASGAFSCIKSSDHTWRSNISFFYIKIISCSMIIINIIIFLSLL